MLSRRRVGYDMPMVLFSCRHRYHGVNAFGNRLDSSELLISLAWDSCSILHYQYRVSSSVTLITFEVDLTRNEKCGTKLYVWPICVEKAHELLLQDENLYVSSQPASELSTYTESHPREAQRSSFLEPSCT